jgi:hypothetical protein
VPPLRSFKWQFSDWGMQCLVALHRPVLHGSMHSFNFEPNQVEILSVPHTRAHTHTHTHTLSHTQHNRIAAECSVSFCLSSCPGSIRPLVGALGFSAPDPSNLFIPPSTSTTTTCFQGSGLPDTSDPPSELPPSLLSHSTIGVL